MPNKLLLFFSVLYCFNAAGQALPKWPDNKKSVIVLTYDDALASHLSVAIPQLNQYKLKATFFLDGRFSQEQVRQWKSASDKGHELANHSLYHPCSRNAFKSRERLYSEGYDVVSILSEIGMMNKILFMIDGKKERTYAYPCTETSVGGTDYVDTLRSSGLVKYARVGGNQNAIITSLSDFDYLRIPSFGVAQNQTGDELINYAKKVNVAGGIGVLMFHGVGGDYISVSAEAHEKFLQYLKEHQKEIWVTTFQEAMDYLFEQKAN